MADKKVITVFGSTGNQGGSVIRAILSHPQLSSSFKVRGITRDPSKPNAQKLASHGVELTKADLNDRTSLDAAIKGSYAVFAVTNFWETLSKDIEVQQGKNIADTSLKNGVKHLVWSSLPHVSEMTKGTLKHVLHFDGKAEVEQYIESIKGDEMIATFFMPGFFMSNLQGMAQPSSNGTLTLSLPFDAKKTHVPLFDVVSDTGKYVAGALLAGETNPAKVDKVHIHGVSEWATPEHIAETVTRVTGKDTKFNSVTPEVYEGFLPANIAKEMVETMVLIRDYSYYGNSAPTEQEKSDSVLAGQKVTDLATFVKSSWVEGKTSTLAW